MPASANFVAVFFQAALSTANSFFSASVPCTFGSSLMTSLPGPQVGKLDTAQAILPPVGCNADNAALRVGSSACSGCLMLEKIDGIRFRRDVMTDLND